MLTTDPPAGSHGSTARRLGTRESLQQGRPWCPVCDERREDREAREALVAHLTADLDRIEARRRGAEWAPRGHSPRDRDLAADALSIAIEDGYWSEMQRQDKRLHALRLRNRLRGRTP